MLTPPHHPAPPPTTPTPSQKQIIYKSSVTFNLSKSTLMRILDVFLKYFKLGNYYFLILADTLCRYLCVMFWLTSQTGFGTNWGGEFELGKHWFWSNCLLLLFIYKGWIRYKCERAKKDWRKSQGKDGVIAHSCLETVTPKTVYFLSTLIKTLYLV